MIDEDYIPSPLGGDFELHNAEATPAEVAPPPEVDPVEAMAVQFKAAQDERDRALAERDLERERAKALEQRVEKADTDELSHHRTLAEQAISTTQAAMTEARRSYREARELGDLEAELAATEALADAKLQLRELENLKLNIEEVAKQPRKPVVAPPDPVEHFIDTQVEHPRDKEWLRAHKADIFGKKDREELAVLGDRVARLKGLKPGDDAYYEFLDAHMGFETPEADDVEDAPPARSTEPPKATVTPIKSKRSSSPTPTRGSAGGTARQATPEETALARDLGMSAAKYVEYMDGLRADKYTTHRLIK